MLMPRKEQGFTFTWKAGEWEAGEWKAIMVVIERTLS